MLVIGLTGGIAAGKSSVADYLRRLGAKLINADEVGHEVIRRGSQAWREIIRQFGHQVLGADGEIDRPSLAAMVFADRASLDRLNDITHPRIRDEIGERLKTIACQDPSAIVVIEAAVLLEARMEQLVDEVWVVKVDGSEQLRRGLERGDREADLARRIKAQIPWEEKLARADRVIDNSGSWQETRADLDRIWPELQHKVMGWQS